LIERISQAQRDVEDPVERVEVTCFAYVEYGAEFPHRYALLFRAKRDQEEKRAVGDRGAAALQTLVDSIAACKTAGRSTSVDPYDDGVAVWCAIHGLTTLRASRPHFAQLHSKAMLRESFTTWRASACPRSWSDLMARVLRTPRGSHSRLVLARP
jgi:WHG domain-containing protein